MGWTEFTVFMMAPAGALAIGYLVMRMSRRETEQFDQRRRNPQQ